MIKEIYGKKVGMTQIFNEQGEISPVTLVEVEPVCLLEEIKYPKSVKLKIGCFFVEQAKAKKIKKPISGYFNKMGVGAYKLIREVNIATGADVSFLKKNGEKTEVTTKESPDGVVESGPISREVGVEIFSEGERVHVRAKTKGRGFAGGMKRWGWSGQPKTHGSTSHRRLGSAGASAYPSRIIKGIHMPGHLGNKFRTTKNLQIVRVDKDKHLLFIKGSVPGSRNTIVKMAKIK